MKIALPEGEVVILPAPAGRAVVTIHPNALESAQYIPMTRCETAHPEEVPLFIEHGTSFAWLCDAIDRHENPTTVVDVICRQMQAYVGELRGRRILDFGCGNGASTLGMAGLFPNTEVVGVELDDNLIRLARALAAKRGMTNVRFERSPSGKPSPRSECSTTSC